VAAITKMLRPITAPPRTSVHPGTSIAANAAVLSHAHANARVAINSRASGDSLGLASTAASPSKIATSAITLSRVIEEGMETLLIAEDVARPENLPGRGR
jgi:hypothetical protein